MRNWNSFSKLLLIFFYVVFTVPMRNWNTLCNISFAASIRVFTVPMRNWNDGSVVNTCFFSSSFYSTYEELKPICTDISQGKSATFLQYLWGIETSEILTNSIPSWMVFTVPMRNWNQDKIFLKNCTKSRFYSTYEELKPQNLATFRTVFVSFLQYLWGIETHMLKTWRIPKSYSFYSTYEELKLNISAY